MTPPLIWDEAKRQANLAKHGLDFADAGEVLDSRYRLDLPELRGTEQRTRSVSYALGFLAVLTVVHTGRDGAARIISLRRASRQEREVYDAWLQNEFDDT
ncbi:MAG: BrnT family toxin [Acidovorax sp.]